uniref:Uncharacterized protein n=1 Tax=Panagrolaimus sp. JU765 TaxID=591449 RepID=A0AC34QKK9_9BILA
MMRKAEKYTEMPLDNRGEIVQTYGSDIVEIVRQPNGRIPGGILKNRGAGDYSNQSSSPHGSLPLTDPSVNMPLQPSPYVDNNGYMPQPQPVIFGPPVYKPTTYQPEFEVMVPHRHTTNSENSENTRKTFDKLADVYSDSGDTVQFAGNLRTFLDENVPQGVWILFLICQLILGFVLIFMGTFNYPFCNIQPMIPVFVIISGILLIINSLFRMLGHFPTYRKRRNERKSTLNQDLCFYAIEGLILLAIIVNVILGCVWVYGSKYYVHFEDGFFEETYCDYTLYWFAWWTVTMHLVVFGLMIIAVLFLLIYGST